jgi:nucleotide-binding universal stress UspA family protein
VSALDPAAAATTESIDLAAAITDAATWLRAEGLEVEEETIEGGDPGRSIVELAGRLGAGLIAMSTHARGGIASTALGSTAITVVHDASCPVLVQKPGI